MKSLSCLSTLQRDLRGVESKKPLNNEYESTKLIRLSISNPRYPLNVSHQVNMNKHAFIFCRNLILPLVLSGDFLRVISAVPTERRYLSQVEPLKWRDWNLERWNLASESTKWSRMNKRDTLLNTYFRVFESLLRKIFPAQLRNLGTRLDKFAIRSRNDQN